MKAVIMAGGEGVRLRPLSLGGPKPMTPLLGRPVMEHILTLLKRHGITDICVTLCYRPQAVTDYFGRGGRFGVRLTYWIEEEPLGTAGSVKRCMDHLGREDFLVLSGDCVCDLDLGRLVAFHRAREAAATLALYPHPSPLEYGLVVTDRDGRVERFIEKPSWGQVVTDRINTGIYVLSPAAMERLPGQGRCDFGKDLFPALLAEGLPLYGCTLEGYWRDMGDCGAYLDCVCDALSGKVGLEMGLPQRAPGIWSAQPPPPGVSLSPPCWLGPEGQVGLGCSHTPAARMLALVTLIEMENGGGKVAVPSGASAAVDLVAMGYGGPSSVWTGTARRPGTCMPPSLGCGPPRPPPPGSAPAWGRRAKSWRRWPPRPHGSAPGSGRSPCAQTGAG